MAVFNSPHQQADLEGIAEPKRSMVANGVCGVNDASGLNGSKRDLRVFISPFPWR